MTIIRGTNATIEISSDGERWHPIQSAHASPLADVLEVRGCISDIILGTALAFASPIAQEQVAAAARAEEERYRERILAEMERGSMAGANFRDRFLSHAIGRGIIEGYAHGISCTITWFNRGMFEAFGGAHTRHAMRHRKLARYRQKVRNR